MTANQPANSHTASGKREDGVAAQSCAQYPLSTNAVEQSWLARDQICGVNWRSNPARRYDEAAGGPWTDTGNDTSGRMLAEQEGGW